MDQAAHCLHVALTGGVQHRARAEEQQALEQRVVEDVEQRRGHRQRRRQRHVLGLEGQGEAQPDEDDPDILHRAEGQHALEILLHQLDWVGKDAWNCLVAPVAVSYLDDDGGVGRAKGS